MAEMLAAKNRRYQLTVFSKLKNMFYQVFFSISAIGREVTAEKPEYCGDAEVYFELFRSLNEDGDFFGLVDTQRTCLQIAYESEEDKYWFEVPRPDIGGSYGKYLYLEEALEVLNSLPMHFPTEGLVGSEFVAW